MKYIDYVNYLKSNNIILFDHDYRVSYFNINTHILNPRSTNNMRGGGVYLSKYNYHELNNIVKIALSVNPQYLLYLATQ